ncbi:hypothetical protein FACS1894137_11790 [Spirochaetia bacterium]|nr:hypothetical protein FACS1894137_11790 [Spirochaetia bacterium]
MSGAEAPGADADLRSGSNSPQTGMHRSVPPEADTVTSRPCWLSDNSENRGALFLPLILISLKKKGMEEGDMVFQILEGVVLLVLGISIIMIAQNLKKS